MALEGCVALSPDQSVTDMPRYFFHHSDGYFERDHTGSDLADLNAARIEAVMFAGQSLRDDPAQVWSGTDLRVEVADASGLILFTIVVIAIDSPAVSLQPSSV